ncbi:hypothetical protein BJ741DRAFT_665574 [Chytriomyces cf. hyalinus JEL632]|nr:hypothetical protein BJ741DRAFT_665574 [Chytriomyces cf. hyalinus JEL632]
MDHSIPPKTDRPHDRMKWNNNGTVFALIDYENEQLVFSKEQTFTIRSDYENKFGIKAHHIRMFFKEVEDLQLELDLKYADEDNVVENPNAIHIHAGHSMGPIPPDGSSDSHEMEQNCSNDRNEVAAKPHHIAQFFKEADDLQLDLELKYAAEKDVVRDNVNVADSLMGEYVATVREGDLAKDAQQGGSTVKATDRLSDKAMKESVVVESKVTSKMRDDELVARSSTVVTGECKTPVHIQLNYLIPKTYFADSDDESIADSVRETPLLPRPLT